MINPPPLKPGDTLGVFAPAGPVDGQELTQGIQRLESLGFKVKLGKSVYQSLRYLAGTDQERVQDFLELYQDPEIRGLVAARGGYGTLRMIPFLEPQLFIQNPKVVVGSSDLTFLLLFLLKQCELVSFHGPMVGPNFGRKPSKTTDEFFLRNLFAEYTKTPCTYPVAKVLKKGVVEGVLTGGCLSLLCQSISTPFEVETEGSVLFLEDIDESPYRIDRMLTYLKAVGKFEGVKGIIFGTMEKCHPLPGEAYKLQEVLLDCLDDFPGPILYGFPSGHGEHNVTLPLGVRVGLDGNHGELKLLERGTLEC